jgi:hypothetical protein
MSVPAATDLTAIYGKPWWTQGIAPPTPYPATQAAASAAPAPVVAPAVTAAISAAGVASQTNASQQQLTLALALLTSIQTEISEMGVETDALRAQIVSTAQVVQQAVATFQKLANPQITPAEIVAATADLKTASDSLLQAATAASAAIAPAGAVAPAPAAPAAAS